MKGIISYLTFITLISLLLCSCGHRNNDIEVWQKDRDNVVKVEVVSIEDSLPAMHSTTVCFIVGDTLIFNDFQSFDRQFAAYDLKSNKFLGWFGRYGNGPGEVANFGAVVIDQKNRMLYGLNASQWAYIGFDLDEAVGDPDYKTFVKSRIPNNENKFPITTATYINDSTVISTVWFPNKEWTAFEMRLGQLNLRKGTTTFLSHPPFETGSKYHTDASEANDLIVACGVNIDKINLYDMSGALKKQIFGPDYTGEPKIKVSYTRYNRIPLITDERIYIVYQDKDIIELTTDGDYIRTIHVGIPINSMVYNKSSNRLFISSEAEPQFGYIQL